MLNVTIPWDLSVARVEMDFMEMEPTAQVTCYDVFKLRLLAVSFEVT